MSQSPTSTEDQIRVHIGEAEARGARRVGLIWMLVASLVAIIVVMGLTLAYYAGSLAEANRLGGPTSVHKADAAKFHTLPSSGG